MNSIYKNSCQVYRGRITRLSSSLVALTRPAIRQGEALQLDVVLLRFAAMMGELVSVFGAKNLHAAKGSGLTYHFTLFNHLPRGQ